MIMKSKVQVVDGVTLDKQANLTPLQMAVHCFYRMPIAIQVLLTIMIAGIISAFGVHWLLCIPVTLSFMVFLRLWEKNASAHLPSYVYVS